MKKIFFLSLLLFAFGFGNAQSERYLKTMEAKVAAIDTTYNPAGLVELANTFERIGDAEKTQWLPYYYAALAHVNSGLMQMNGGSVDAAKTDPIADKAEAALNKAAALTPDNAEVQILRKMIANLRMMGDPMNRFMTYGQQGAQALAKAKTLNPDNPRIYMLEAQDKFYTPEQFGGSKAEAKTLFETAMQKFASFKPESSLHPQWGKRTVQYFIAQAK
ncbi:hypothetical protein SAMN05444008_1271 [Cnuella takakiae]|uniref:Tetratricopeptide repeat-containing protein n=1 Tax=Cnuella takakiae TaxID=1302690 RepID=A0A1M5J0D9_9BACT|nr:hypothetical protein [Cnuella takakiae]OLY91349.1 hypothetical protein BUE76_05120 [Cnuella takakiae]SHG34026.1 hypothetical protein SAMN05444008_1271 [Cnuella takakiae]